MSWSAVRTAIKTRLDALSNLGPVHVYERAMAETAEQQAFQDAFAESGVLNFAWVQPVGGEDLPDESTDTRSRRRHSVKIEYFLAVADAAASGTTHQDRTYAILDNLRTGDRTLGGACLTYKLPSWQVAIVAFAGVLAHRATINFTVEEVL